MFWSKLQQSYARHLLPDLSEFFVKNSDDLTSRRDALVLVQRQKIAYLSGWVLFVLSKSKKWKACSSSHCLSEVDCSNLPTDYKSIIDLSRGRLKIPSLEWR